MKTYTRTMVLLLVGLLSLGLLAPPAIADDDDRQRAMLNDLGFPGVVTGRATLERDDDGADFKIRAHGLSPGHVVTIWAVTFSNPAACTHGVKPPLRCDTPDWWNPATQATSRWAAGTVVGANGRATFRGHLEEGDGSGAVFVPGVPFPAPGLGDAEKDEIHLVLRTHGPAIAGRVEAQRTTFGDACTALPAGMTGNTGALGPNTCGNIAFAGFVAPDDDDDEDDDDD